MLLLELLCQFIIIVILMQKDAINLVVLYFDFDDG